MFVANLLFVQCVFWLIGASAWWVYVDLCELTHKKKSQTRFMMLAGMSSLTPILCFSLLPALLVGRPIFSYTVTLLFLFILPIIISFFTIRVDDLSASRKRFIQISGTFLSLNMLGSSYLLVKLQLQKTSLYASQEPAHFVIDLCLIALAFGLFHLLNQYLRGRLNYLFGIPARSAKDYAVSQELLRRDAAIRREFAADLHHNVLSRLAVLMGDVDALSLDDADGQSREDEIARLKAHITEIDEVTRCLIESNCPPELELGLKYALKIMQEQFSIAHPDLEMSLTFEGRPQKKLPRETALNLYRIVEEALHNIAKHADASTVSVSITIANDELKLAVVDDGEGFDPSVPVSGHFGLRIMQTMAMAIDGDYDIQSNKGDGTSVLVCVPLASENELYNIILEEQGSIHYA